MDNLKKALDSTVSIASGSVSSTLAIADTAVKSASKIAGTTVNAAGVLGDESVKAAETIGVAAISAGTDVATTALGVGADISNKALAASATIANATSQATADIAGTALVTTASTVQTTTEQVGKALKAGVTLAGNSATSALKGLDNVRAIVAGRGEVYTTSTLQKQGAELQGVAARKSLDTKKEFLKALEQLQNSVKATLNSAEGSNKATLLMKMNIYKRAKCGIIRRLIGFCDSKMLSRDLKATELILNDFRTAVDSAYNTAKTAVLDMPDTAVSTYDVITKEYTNAGATALNIYNAAYKPLIDKYDRLTRKALGMIGGRRRNTARKLHRHGRKIIKTRRH